MGGRGMTKGATPTSLARQLNAGLFPSEFEIARRLSQTAQAWRAKAQVLERDGMPKVDPIMGGRYWPAVEAYFNRRYGIATSAPSALDGMENLDALR
jgi:hypothetical protein